MYPPEVKVFTNRTEAYEYYKRVAPDLHDPDNEAELHESEGGEAIVQLHGYDFGMSCRAKRPEGASIKRVVVDDTK